MSCAALVMAWALPQKPRRSANFEAVAGILRQVGKYNLDDYEINREAELTAD